ncbi:hypothetical protein BCR33DRAFT_719081 [Rhizoclosmatium globosum]|uniref:RBR-type E3 ubiquitin transferase n=1 Tax=Rhizoclosmatium globosum TaxID=329046 RepID=A0A1Y2C1Z7_9FUNG|nr:hypothetical protein BCR33DRAFT_719081 [Rhizoclosmatium globosum]|eukprot:ORY40976.1 hypothetical protein BCR33DRAFT_719081 [Rhizoclosmatium globosum]
MSDYEASENETENESMAASYHYDDDEDDLNDDELMDEFDDAPVTRDADVRRSYTVAFEVRTSEDLARVQQTEADDVGAVLGVSTEAAATLLRFFRWRKDRLLEDYYGNPDSDALLKRAEDFECPVCFDVDCPVAQLKCAHAFCTACYARYLSGRITEEGESRRIQCPDASCSVIVDEKTVETLVDPKVFEKYKALLIKSYVDDVPSLKWCPHPNCEYAVQCKVPASSLDEIVPSVKCGDGHSFCFGCSLPQDHQPCVCSLVKLWLKKCADDSETANWISANTKECEKCQSTIEKNGGCNHMTCRKCKYEFCWVCMGPWSDHGTQWYNCNRFDEKASIDARDNQAKYRAALERYLHYFNRYANHEQSAKLDKELSEKISAKMLEMQKTTEMSWIEVQFLSTAKEILLASRNTLKWTYCFAYYLTRDNTTELFENNQRDLEMAVEQLSELLEGQFEVEKMGEVKQKILDKSVYVSGRREVLLTATAADLADGRFTWSLESSQTLALLAPAGKK